MGSNSRSVVAEANILKRQRVAFVTAFVLMVAGGLISLRVLGVAKYGVLAACIPMLYLGASSIKNRLSVIRMRGQRGHSRETRVVIFGVFVLVLAIFYVVAIFVPPLSDILFPL